MQKQPPRLRRDELKRVSRGITREKEKIRLRQPLWMRNAVEQKREAEEHHRLNESQTAGIWDRASRKGRKKRSRP